MSRLALTLRDVVWPRRGWRGKAAWLALQPATFLFGTGVRLREAAYRFGLFPVQQAGIPVVSIGNLAVGGTGKTPMTLWLARHLKAEGLRVGIVLRGYAGSARGVTLVSRGQGPEVDAAEAGDEAVMLARSFDGAVVTSRRRIEGVAALEALGIQVALLDDGFQHRTLARDFDLVLLNGREGSLLPSGPMREPRSALERADAIALVSKEARTGRMLGRVSQAAGKPLFVVHFAPTALVESDGGHWRTRPLEGLAGRRAAVLCGIADPRPFYETLRNWGVKIEEIFEFPDHHRYTAQDWQDVARATRAIDTILTTEKDLVKLENFPFARGKLMALRVEAQVSEGDRLVTMIRNRLGVLPAVPIQKETPDGPEQ